MGDINITLTNDEALVLFEMLSRFTDSNILTIVHQAEERALWNLNCLIEETLVDIVKPNYIELLQAARSRLKDDE